MSNTKFYVKIINWEKHQKKLKAGHSHFMLSKRFFDDAKIALLKQNECLLYINLLSIAADLMTNSFVIHAKMLPTLLRIGDKSLHNCLDRLQSFQLLTYEKDALNRIEDNRIENKIKEEKLPVPQNPKKITNKEDTENNRKIWESYSNAFRLRYGIDPIRNATINSQISNLRKKLGIDNAIEVVKFYLTHNDTWYIKNTHSFGLCLKDAETLRTQMLKGKAITMNDVRRFEKSLEQRKIIDDANEGGF